MDWWSRFIRLSASHRWLKSFCPCTTPDRRCFREDTSILVVDHPIFAGTISSNISRTLIWIDYAFKIRWTVEPPKQITKKMEWPLLIVWSMVQQSDYNYLGRYPELKHIEPWTAVCWIPELTLAIISSSIYHSKFPWNTPLCSSILPHSKKNNFCWSNHFKCCNKQFKVFDQQSISISISIWPQLLQLKFPL